MSTHETCVAGSGTPVPASSAAAPAGPWRQGPFVDAKSFRAGMRNLASAVAVVTTWHEGAPWGLTVSSVCSLSVDPPTLLVCVNRDAEAHPRIIASGRVGVNVLSADQQALADRFSSRELASGPARFSGQGWQLAGFGAPILTDCLVAFACELVATMECKTHTVFACAVQDVVPGTAGPAPLVYYRRAFGRLVATPVDPSRV